MKELYDFNFSSYQKHYTDEGFWEKVKAIAKKAGAKLIYAALKLYYAAQAPQTPPWAKAIIYGALGYLILPIDVLPDVLPGIGFTDDLAMIAAALAVTASNITDDVKLKARGKMSEWFGGIDDLTEDIE